MIFWCSQLKLLANFSNLETQQMHYEDPAIKGFSVRLGGPPVETEH